MNFMTKKLRSLASIFALAFTAFALASCSDIADFGNENSSKAGDKCTVRFSMENPARQANPEYLSPVELSYKLSYYQNSSESSGDEKSIESASSSTETKLLANGSLLSYEEFKASSLELSEGSWTFELTAFSGGTAILHSSVTQEITTGYTNTIIFNLEEYAEGNGVGSISVNFNYYNKDVKSVSAKLLNFSSGEAVTGYEEISFDLSEIDSSSDLGTVTYAKDDVSTGSYILVFTVTRTSEDSDGTTKTPVFVIVRAGRESSSTEIELLKITEEEQYLPFSIHFCFWDDDKEEYAEDSQFPTLNVTEDNYNSFESVIADYTKKIIQSGYTPSTTKTSDSEPVKQADGTYAMYIYFDKAEITVTRLSISPESATVEVGKSVTFTAALEYSDGTSTKITNLSAGSSDSDSGIAVVNTNSDGVITVTGVSAGTISVTVTAVVDSEEKSATISVTVVPVSTTSAISVTLDEFDTADLGDNFTVSAEMKDGSLVVTVTPATVVDGYSYQWYLDDAAIDGATAQSYTWTAEMVEALEAGIHNVMLEITDNSGTTTEHYSASTTFTVEK